MKKFSLWLSKMLFFNFGLFHFPKFQITIVKNFMEKPSFFIMDFESSNEVLLRHNYFDVQIFDNETTALLNIFEICTEMCFVSIFFLNERNITISLLIIATFKEYCFAWYVKLSSRSIIKSFLNYMPPNMLFRFFRFLIYVYFNEAFVKNLSKNYFLIQISKIQISFQDIRIVY